ncbi:MULTISPECIES: SEC-C metal-binding domain-containing protein [unclassified Sphingopyxis]|uniref:SEC-C metal-binding domain-containing protein n=1 Tax=unclassified Sphingopyxis TaxID=2614943 RepID=UPI0039C8FD78
MGAEHILVRRRLRAIRRADHRRPSWYAKKTSPTCPAFEISSKRRKGYPSETQVKRGHRFVHGDKELIEKLGRQDPCPCGSGLRFPQLLPDIGPISTALNG